MSQPLLTGILISLCVHAAILLPWSVNTQHAYISSQETAPLLVTLSDSPQSVPVRTKPQPLPPRQTIPQTAPSTNMQEALAVPPPPAAMDVAAVPDHTVRSKVLNVVKTDFSRNFYYPMLARRNGWQGHVVLGFAVESNGAITQIHIARSSGHAILDESALAALQTLRTLSEAEGWLQGNRIELRLPVEYRLTGG